MEIAGILLSYALKNNFHLAVLLVIIIALGIYAMFKFKLSEQSTGFKFNFIGEKLNTIDKNVNGLVAVVGEHSDKIIKLETIQIKLSEKFKREQERRTNAN